MVKCKFQVCLIQHSRPPQVDHHPFVMFMQKGRGSGSGGRMWTCACPHRKLEPTDVILFSSHAKKLAGFWTRISSLDRIKSGNFSSV